MKKITLSLLALMFAPPIIFSRCKKDDENPIVNSVKMTASKVLS